MFKKLFSWFFGKKAKESYDDSALWNVWGKRRT